MTDTSAARELRVEGVVAAAPQRVWDVLTDFARMPDWSPELVRMIPVGGAELRVGRQYLGINKRKAVVWPTRSVVCLLEPGRAVGWDTPSSGARWIWELEPAGDSTRVVHRRPVPQRLSRMSGLFARAFLGGVDGHADELETGMVTTLDRLRRAVEAG